MFSDTPFSAPRTLARLPLARRWPTLLPLALATLLAGCGGLPRPFEGMIGANGRRLSQPPPARLSVAPPMNAMLSDMGADTLAGALVDSLVAEEVPAVLDTPHKGDWSLALTADLKDGKVVPNYEVHDPSGKPMGVSLGQPVDPRAWSDADPKTMRAAAASAAPSIASLLARIDAAQRQSDPNSLLNRPARVAVTGVTGAPGDGNAALARQMRQELPKLGEVVQDTTTQADFVVAGQVNMEKGAGNTQRVEIQWIVSDAKGEERGRIVQLNEVPPGTLDRLWGDVALVVAQEAAGGVKDVILNQTGARQPRGQPADAKPAGAPPADAPQAGTSQAGTSQAGTSQAGTSQAGTSQAGAQQGGTSQAGAQPAGAPQTGAQRAVAPPFAAPSR